MKRLCRTQIVIILSFVSLFVYSTLQSADKAEITSTGKSTFTADELSLPGKKGACFTLRETGETGSAEKNIPKTKALNVYWNYSWGSNISDKQPADIEFVPMVWGTWMRDFMKEVDVRGYRVDYFGVHGYGGTSARHFKKKMRLIYEKYGRRPLLITEFAPADWNTKGDHAKNSKRVAQVLAFAKEVLPWMEEQEWIADDNKY